MRQSTIFYKSFYDSIKLLPKRYQLTFYEDLFNYIFDDVEPTHLNGSSMALFKALKPQIDVNNKRYENGCKGGRPKSNQSKTKAKPNDNQNETKPQTKAKPNYNYNLNDNHNDNDNHNHNDNAVGGGRGFSDDDFNLLHSMTPQDVDTIYEAYPESGGDLIEEVNKDVMRKKKTVKDPVAYILGYAKNVGWDDKADHFEEA